MKGDTVEVINTDAEGRLILADALHYAKKYNPKSFLYIDRASRRHPAVFGYLSLNWYSVLCS